MNISNIFPSRKRRLNGEQSLLEQRKRARTEASFQPAALSNKVCEPDGLGKRTNHAVDPSQGGKPVQKRTISTVQRKLVFATVPPVPDTIPPPASPAVPRTPKGSSQSTAGGLSTKIQPPCIPQPPEQSQPPKKRFASRGSMLLAATGKAGPNTDSVPTRQSRLAKIMAPASPKKRPLEALATTTMRTSAMPTSAKVPLPTSYEDLEHMFEALDLALRQQKMRLETLTLKKAKVFVGNFCRRTFEKQHLAQIASVAPEMFTFKCVWCEKAAENREWAEEKDRYRLLIDGDLSHEYTDGTVERVSMTRVLQRKAIFHGSLVERVAAAHQRFLETLDGYRDIAATVSAPYSLRTWHPKFDLEAMPAIECAQLPEPPVKRVVSAKGILNAATKLPPVIQRALEKVGARKEQEREKDATNGSGPADTDTTSNTAKEMFALVIKSKAEGLPEGSATPMAKKLMGIIPQDLLQKVQERQLLRDRKRMFGLSSADAERLGQVQQAEHTANLISSAFGGEVGKSVLPMDVVVEKARQSCRTPMAATTIREVISLLTEIVPEWISCVKTDNGTFVQLDKKTPMGLVRAKISTAKDNASRSKEEATLRVYSF